MNNHSTFNNSMNKSLTKITKNKQNSKKKIIYFNWMFYNCRALSSIQNISKWNISKIIDMTTCFIIVNH